MRKTSLAFILLLSLAALLASCDLVLPGNDTPLKYTVTYYTSSLGDKVLIAYECNLGDRIPVPATPPPGQDPFYGWSYFTEDFIPLHYDDESQMKVTGNLIAFPTNPVYQYVSFSYIFEGDFDSAQSGYNYFIRGEEIVFPEPPEKENYTFAGWYRDRELTDKVEGTETCPETEAFFYGYYKSDIPIHTLDFAAIGRKEVFLDGTSFVYDYSIPSGPSSEPFTFAGWHFDSSSGERLYPETAITRDATMYPRYVEAEIVDILGTYFLFSNGDVYNSDTERVEFSGISAMAYYNGHLHLFREDGKYYLDNKLPDYLHEIGLGAGKIIQADSGGTFLAILDDSGQLFVQGNISGGSSVGSFSRMEETIGHVVQIDANRNTLAIKNSNGELYMIGASLDSLNGEYDSWTKVFDGVKDFSLGNSAIFVIDDNDDLWFRGVRNDTWLQGSDDVSYEFMKVGSGVTSVAGYQGGDTADGRCNYYLYTKDDGVYVYGKHNLYGTGLYVEADPEQLFFEGFSTVKNFSKGFVFFDSDGNLYMRGSLDDLPVDYEPYVDEPFAVLSGESVKEVRTSSLTGFALTDEGDLYYWGHDNFDMLNKIQATPKLILNGIKTISDSRAFANDGTVYDLSWSKGGKPAIEDTHSFSGIVKEEKGDYALTENGELWHLGSSASSVYKIDDSVTDFFLYGNSLFGYIYEEEGNFLYKSMEDGLSINNVIKAVKTLYVELVLLKDGSVYWRGSNTGDSHGPLHPRVEDRAYTANFTPLDESRTFTDIAVIGGNAIFLLDDSGPLLALGDTRSIGFDRFTSVNPYYVCLTRADRILEYGEDNISDYITIQDGSALYFVLPEVRDNIIDSYVEEVSHGRSYKQMTMSGGAYLAIDEDGQLWSWGNNSEGLCGNGESSYSLDPVRIDFSTWTIN